MSPIDNPLSITADWNDLDAATRTVFRRCAVADEGVEAVYAQYEHPADQLLPSIERPALSKTWNLVSLEGLTGRLVVTRADATIDENADITIEVSVGPFGEPGLEACILDGLRQRLRQLRGRSVAPVRFQ